MSECRRTSRQRLKSGKVIEHYQLVESVWQRQTKKSRTSIIYNFGRVDRLLVKAVSRQVVMILRYPAGIRQQKTQLWQ
jgi:hypothetical protein